MSNIQQGISLRKAGKLIEANHLFLELLKNEPENSQLNYQCAWSFDSLGEEKLAVPYYIKAIDGNLNREDLEGAYLGLGSTYRTLGDYQASKNTFLTAISLFPDKEVFKVFYSMTLYNLEEHSKAMEILLTTLIKTSSDQSIQEYEKALLFYAPQ